MVRQRLGRGAGRGPRCGPQVSGRTLCVCCRHRSDNVQNVPHTFLTPLDTPPVQRAGSGLVLMSLVHLLPRLPSPSAAHHLQPDRRRGSRLVEYPIWTSPKQHALTLTATTALTTAVVPVLELMAKQQSSPLRLLAGAGTPEARSYTTAEPPPGSLSPGAAVPTPSHGPGGVPTSSAGEPGPHTPNRVAAAALRAGEAAQVAA